MGYCIALSVTAAVFFYLMAAFSWIVGVVGFALLVEGNDTAMSTSLTVHGYPYWAFAVGTPVVLIIAGVHIAILACQVRAKICWVCCSLPLVLMPTYVIFVAGALVYKDSAELDAIIKGNVPLRGEYIYALLRFTGALGSAVFMMITMVCEYAAVPYIFSEGSSRNQVAPTTSFPPPPVTWNAKDTLRRSSTSSTTDLIKQNESVDQPTTLGTGDGGDPPPENNIEMTEQTHDTETPTQLQKEETKF